MVKYLLTDTVGYNCLQIKGLATTGYCFNISFRHPFLSLVKSTSNVKFLILVIIYELEKLGWGGGSGFLALSTISLAFRRAWQSEMFETPCQKVWMPGSRKRLRRNSS